MFCVFKGSVVSVTALQSVRVKKVLARTLP
jgi:hypothetical protein